MCCTGRDGWIPAVCACIAAAIEEWKLAAPFRPDRTGDELTRWVEQTAPRALAYAGSLVGRGAEAEDVVQDCYLRLLAKAGKYDLPADGVKLLFKAITNACINLVQRRPPVVSLESGSEASGEAGNWLADRAAGGPEAGAMQRELEDAVALALERLPVTQRAVVELRSLGHPVTEIAEMLDVTHSNARVLLHRARETLAVELRSYLEEGER